MNMKKEILARVLVISLLLIAIAVPVGGYLISSANMGHVVELHARMPENGGWSAGNITVQVGQPITLHMTSDDVVHGFAIGKSNQPAIEILPGEFVDKTLTFDKTGTYTFYCTHWCGPNHWRMRGTIEVTGAGPALQLDTEPLYLQLGIDIDAPHPAKVVPTIQPSAERGAKLAYLLPDYALSRETYLTTSPADLWLKLRAEPSISKLSDNDLWDVVRWLWERQSSPESLSKGLKIFMDFAAAAHGMTGKGDGVMVKGRPTMTPKNMGHILVRPPDFTDPHTLLGASPALLEGKIIRGGMGTGMPSWGAIFTQQQIDAIVGYLYTIAWNSVGVSPATPTQEVSHP